MTAAGIATLAFSEFIKAGAGEIAKKSIEPLQEAIRKRFVGHKKAKDAIAKIETEGSPDADTTATYCLFMSVSPAIGQLQILKM